MMRRTPLKQSGFKPKAASVPGILRTATVKPGKPTLGAKLRMRKCAVKGCRARFQPRSMAHRSCSPEHAVLLVTAEREKNERKDLAARKLAIKPRAKWLKEAEEAFNAFIRTRDAHLPCISCGRFHTGSYDAGHYRSVGSMPSLRFHEDNVHRQCVPCNQHKAGNVVEYRIRLARKIGTERLEWLEGPHEPCKYTIEQLTAIKVEYRAKTKALKGAM